MVLLAAVIGVLGGLGAVGFRLMIQGVQHVAWGSGTFGVDLVRAHPWWWIALTPAVGGIIVGLAVRYFAEEAKGHGVPEVMEAVILRSGAIRPRLVAVKSLASAVCIGTGGSVGREGPIVQIGSALASGMGQLLRVSRSQLRTLAASGAAAGIAATFNAPLAGSLFGVEIVLGDFAVSEFSAIVISAVSATVVSRHFLGSRPLFDVPPHTLVSAWEVFPYAVLGVAAAGVALMLIWGIYAAEDLFDRFPTVPWVTSAVGGLLVGVLALARPEILGVGYPVPEGAVWGRLSLTMLLVLIPAKLLATSLTLGSGGSGGIFAPSLFLGALTGGAVGTAAHFWFPGVTAPAGAYALVGMGAVVAAATHAPLTGILMIFELTSDYRMILPLMASCMIATLITTHLRRESIYTLKLVRRGVDIFRGQATNVLRELRVSDVMSREVHTVGEEESLGRMLDGIGADPFSHLYVVRDGGHFVGVIELRRLRDALVRSDVLGDLLLAGELALEDLPTVGPNESLDVVSAVFADGDLEELPVVDPSDGRLLGAISGHRVLDAYNRELLKRDMVRSVGSSLDAAESHEVGLGDGYRMVQTEAPESLAGHSLRDLDLRARYGVTVMLIRRPADSAGRQSIEVVPSPDTVVQARDALVVVGTRDALNRFKGLRVGE